MFTIFAGSILANLLLGEPCLTPFKNNNQLLLATSVWYVNITVRLYNNIAKTENSGESNESYLL
jgi:hypothetical protein